MVSSKNFEFHIISISTYGHGLSGGDRIFIELAKRLGRQCPVSIYVWEEGLALCRREDLVNVKYVLWSSKFWSKFGFFINYFARILIGIYRSLTLNIKNSPYTIVYSASEFWQDSLPAFILKARYPKAKWVAAWYQTAPNPFKGFSEQKEKRRYRLNAFLYWFVQLPIKPLIEQFADFVIVNNENEKIQFSEMDKRNKVLVMLGAIDLDKINKYKSLNKKTSKNYDGVFQGRFHPQKGVVELVDIWRIVTKNRPQAKLAMIGDGPLMNEVKKKISEYKLENNITLFGYLFDGPHKYDIFSQSKVVLHPAFYDSGGMASAEAMAFGIPIVGFDLIAYKSYYPKGMVKAKTGNIEDFAKQILFLLRNDKFRINLGQEGLKMLESNWSWDARVDSLLNMLLKTES